MKYIDVVIIDTLGEAQDGERAPIEPRQYVRMDYFMEHATGYFKPLEPGVRMVLSCERLSEDELRYLVRGRGR